MSENIEKSVRINFGRVSKQSQKGQRKKKVRESSVGALKCYKKWVTHDHESVNHLVVACRGGLQMPYWALKFSLNKM